MKIVLAGGSGSLGRILTRAFETEHEVVVLTRDENNAGVVWDGRTLGTWAEELDGADVLINLAGRSVDCRYNAARRAEIMDSRVDSTRVLGQAIARAKRPPRVWLQSSTATIYEHEYGAANDELIGRIGGHEPDVPEDWRFSIEVAQAWERALDEADTPHTRKVKLRTAMVMSTEEGSAFRLLLRHIRLGFGRFGDGRQYMSWIHERDFVAALRWLIAHDEIEGVVNLAAPNPLPNADFLRALRKAWGTRLAIPSAGLVLRFGAWLVRTEPELVLKSRRVVSRRLAENGFRFAFAQWPDAARELCARMRNGAEGSTW
jgi:uncharacterized protein